LTVTKAKLGGVDWYGYRISWSVGIGSDDSYESCYGEAKTHVLDSHVL